MAGYQDIGRLVATLGLNTSPFMASANGAMNSLRNIQVSMMMTGRALTRFVTLPMVLAGAGVVNMQKKFESSMTKVIGLVGISKEQVDEWKESILDLAKETGRMPTELADAMYFITSSGLEGTKAMEALTYSAKAAAVGLGETKDIADLVTSAMNAYKDSNLGAAEAVDIIIATIREGKAEVEDLVGALGKVIPIASAFGVSLNDVGATFAAMTRTGTQADIVATQLKAILNAMADPSDEAADAMGRYKYTAEQFKKTVREGGLLAGLLELNKVVKNNETAFAEVFPNIRALVGILDLLGDNMEDNVRIFQTLRDNTGTLKKALEAVYETTQFKLDKALAGLGVAAIKFGETLKGPVVNALTGITDWLDRLTEKYDAMSEAQKIATFEVVKFVAVIGPAMVIISRLWAILATNPIGVLITAFALLSLAVLKYRAAMDGVTIAQKAAHNIQGRIIQISGQEKAKVEQLVNAIKDENTTLDTKKGLYKDLAAISVTHFGHLDAEKTKVEDLMKAQKNYNDELLLTSTIQAAQQLLIEAQAKLMEQQSKAATDVPFGKKAWAGLLSATGQIAAALGDIVGREVHWQTVSEQLWEEKQDGIIETTNLIEEYTKMIELATKNLIELQQKLRAGTGTEDKDGDDGDGDDEVLQLGYLWQLQKDINFEQNVALGVAREELATRLDIVRGLQREFAIAQLLSNEYGYVGEINKNIATAQMLQENASEGNWRILQKYIQEGQKVLQWNALLVNGLGAVEEVQWDIAQMQEKIENANEAEVDALKEQLQLLYDKEELLTRMNDPYRENLLLAQQGTKVWQQHYQDRLAQLSTWMQQSEAAGQTELDRYRTWTQEKYDIEQMLHDWKLQTASEYLGVAQDVISSITQAIQNQYSSEMAAAGKSKRKREQLEKEYNQKLQAWAMVQSIIQTALAVVKALPNYPLAIATAAAGLIQTGVIASQSFAKGGLVYDETLARVGDYPGARHNPEVIAPLSDLKQLFRSERKATGLPAQIELVAKGNTLYGVIEMEHLLRNTY